MKFDEEKITHERTQLVLFGHEEIAKLLIEAACRAVRFPEITDCRVEIYEASAGQYAARVTVVQMLGDRA